MDQSTIVTIAIIAFIIWVLFFRKINPSNKTDAQLQLMHDMAMKNWDPLKYNENLSLIQAEMKKRGLFGEHKQTEPSTLMEAVTQNAQLLAETIQKIQYLSELFKSNVDISKLNINREKYLNYYLSYLDACAKSISEYGGMEYTESVRTAVFIEAYKLKDNTSKETRFESEDIQQGEALLEAAINSEYGIKGMNEGKSDGDYSNNPSNPGPYFQKLNYFFEN